MNNEKKVCIDLFSGLGGFSSAFEDSEEWDVVTVEIEEKFDPDIQADVLELRASDLMDLVEEQLGYPFDEIDLLVVLASPPCTAFTQMAKQAGDGDGHVSPEGRPNTETGRLGIQLAHHTVGLVRALDPEWYAIENPMAGMRNQLGKPEAEVWWCQYGSRRAKPTDLWGRLPPSFEPERCANGNTDCHHEPAPRGSDSGTQSSDRTSSERAKLPYGLSAAILEAVENPAPKQLTLDQAGVTAK